MRPIITGIVLFLAWMVLSTWYYSTHIFPVLNPAEETTLTETVPQTPEQPPEAQSLPDTPEGITLYFEFDKTEILNSAAVRDWLPAGKEYFEANSDACLQLTGHACNIGTEAYNMDLGERRARSVERYFAGSGFSPDCLLVTSKGESEPAVPNTSEENRKKNRRVELKVTH
jgi:outer membrane protein OmpA-like peptidoglycan-associated protein